MDDENNNNNNDTKKSKSWLESAANIFVIIEAVIKIVYHVANIYHVYQEQKEPTTSQRDHHHDRFEVPEPQNENISPSFPLNPPDDVELNDEDDDKTSCKICMTNKIRTINLPCGHMVFCFGCCRNFVSNNFQHMCPICRARISEIKIAYIS